MDNAVQGLDARWQLERPPVLVRRPVCEADVDLSFLIDEDAAEDVPEDTDVAS